MLPADDLSRTLTHGAPDAANAEHLGVVGDTYTILLRGSDTGGRFCLIDMHVPPGGGPPPHRHDFEETFVVLEGEIEATFRGRTMTVRAGETVNIPANAPHQFRNASGTAARLLCTCAPAGQEELFGAVGVPVGSRTEAPPPPTEEQKLELDAKMPALLVKYKTEMLDHA